MFVVKNKGIFFTISAVLAIAAIVLMSVYGFNTSIDFEGGSLLEVSYINERPTVEIVESQVSEAGIEGFSLRASGESNFILRTKELALEDKAAVIGQLTQGGTIEITEERFNTIGPIVSGQLKSKAVKALSIVVVLILLFVMFAFRKLAQSWKYAFATVIALIHDILIPTGVMVALGAFAGIEIDLLFITALLAILGYSVNDTIVVFDRIRENLLINKESGTSEPYAETVGRSLRQTVGRSINTSLTLIFVLVALFLLSTDSIRYFILTLIVGVLAGTYSSIFLASPLIVLFNKEK